MDNPPLKRTTSSFCSSPHDQHYHSDHHHPFPVDEISVFLQQFLLRHPPSSSFSPPPVPTLLNPGSSVLDPPHDDRHVHFQGRFAGSIADVSINGGVNDPLDGCEAKSEEAPADDLLPPPPKPPRGSSTSKRTRAAEVHNLSEKRRRSRINEKMKALQKLIPNSNKTDKASMLDEAIDYLKQLQLQVQVLSMRNGVAGFHEMSHDDNNNGIAESFLLLQQQTHPAFPASKFGREETESRRMNPNKAEAVSGTNGQQSAAAARVFNLGRQSSTSNVTTNPETHNSIICSPPYLSY